MEMAINRKIIISEKDINTIKHGINKTLKKLGYSNFVDIQIEDKDNELLFKIVAL